MDSSHRLPLTAATGTSAIAAILGLIWIARPETAFFYVDPMNAMLAAIAGPGAALTVHTLVALVGVAAGIGALAGAVRGPGVLAVGVLQTLVFGVGLGSMATLSTAGYLVALAMPVIVLLVVVQVIRRYPVARWTVGVPVLILAGIGLVLGYDGVISLAGYMFPALLDQLGELSVVLLLIATGAAWAAAGIVACRRTPLVTRATAWVTRHRRLFTLIAACGPLPYVLARLTWLTPWPLFGAPEDLATAIWGVTLSSGGWLGIVLTIGLIRPWGEVFPRWMPVLAGRPVPVAAAVIPGGAVAAMLCFAAVPLLHSAAGLGTSELIVFAVTFPCWFWGPALALAVWGYAGHRRSQLTSQPESPVGAV